MKYREKKNGEMQINKTESKDIGKMLAKHNWREHKGY